MKARITTLLFTVVLLCNCAMGYERTIITSSDANDSIAGIIVTLPEYRQIRSGSKIIVSYEGEWSASMKGAFEYAAKLWEENLPMTLPIMITARVASIRGDRDKVSTVSSKVLDFPDSRDPYIKCHSEVI